MRDNLGITMRDESVTVGPQFVPAFDIVEQLTIEHDRDSAVFVKDRLLAVSQSDDAQTARSQGQARPDQKTLFVRATVQ
jgi:hypothetical protein